MFALERRRSHRGKGRQSKAINDRGQAQRKKNEVNQLQKQSRDKGKLRGRKAKTTTGRSGRAMASPLAKKT